MTGIASLLFHQIFGTDARIASPLIDDTSAILIIVSSNLPYRSRAVRAMVLLHEEHLRRFLQTWRLALAKSVNLPPTTDANYSSLGTLGRHVLSAAGGYLVWICEVLGYLNPESDLRRTRTL